jgi:hypothetical protein
LLDSVWSHPIHQYATACFMDPLCLWDPQGTLCFTVFRWSHIGSVKGHSQVGFLSTRYYIIKPKFIGRMTSNTKYWYFGSSSLQ